MTCALDQHLGQIDHRLVRLAGEGVVEGELPHLRGRRLHQPLILEAEAGAPEAGHRLDIFLALVVIDADALAAVDHQRSVDQMRLVIGVGMQRVGDVAGGGGIARGRHGLGLSGWPCEPS